MSSVDGSLSRYVPAAPAAFGAIGMLMEASESHAMNRSGTAWRTWGHYLKSELLHLGAEILILIEK